MDHDAVRALAVGPRGARGQALGPFAVVAGHGQVGHQGARELAPLEGPHPAQALASLKLALGRQLELRENARRDPDFGFIRDTAEFKELTGQA